MSGFFSSPSLTSPALVSIIVPKGPETWRCFSSVVIRLPHSRNLNSRWIGIRDLEFDLLDSSTWDFVISSTWECWIRSTIITMHATMIRAVTTPIITLSVGVSLMGWRGRSEKRKSRKCFLDREVFEILFLTFLAFLEEWIFLKLFYGLSSILLFFVSMCRKGIETVLPTNARKWCILIMKNVFWFYQW